MISKHVECDAANDSYRRLAEYIDADHEQDKVLQSWFSGCFTEDDYDIAVSEVLATQAMNTTAKEEKTYHLLVSFRPEDADKLTPDIFREIEKRFALVLGLQDHQRHCGVHQNTDNLHLHVAYNLIHPETLNRIEPYRDYWKRDKLCRELEQEYGLAVDHGIEQKKEHRLSDRAASMEAFSGKQSFAGYCLERREAILAAVARATNWEYVHQALAKYDIGIKPHGNGLVLQAANNPKLNFKASAFDRSFSKSKLETRFGPYRKKIIIRSTPAQETYQAKPLQKSPLFEEYIKLCNEKRAISASIREEKQKQLADIKSKWKAKRADINFMALTKKDRYGLMAYTYRQEKEQRQRIMDTAQCRYIDLKKRFPYKSWQDFYHQNKQREQVLNSEQQQQKPLEQAQQTVAKPVYRWQTQYAPSKGLSR